MNIDEVKNNNRISFQCLDIGEVFYFGKEYYIKIDSVSAYNNQINAFNLSNNKKESFSYCDMVLRIPKAKLVVQNPEI